MQKVLMTADTVGGVWQYALQLAGALASCGTQVHLATMGAPVSEEQRAAAAALANLALHPSAYRLEWMDDPWEDVQRAGEWLLGLERELRPEVIHLNGYAHAALPWRAPVMVVAHSCVLSWWEACRGEAAPAHWEEYRRQVTAGLRAARMVVAPSRAMLEVLERHYGSVASGRVIYNARQASVFRPATKLKYVFAAGRVWDEAKNIAALDRAAGRVAWPIYVAGDNTHPSRNGADRAAGGDGGGADRGGVQMLGFLRERALASWLALASIYALPARYEPFGLSVLEAALSGCALVLGDIPSLREIWGDAALYVKPDDEDRLVAALEELMLHPARRAMYSARAILRAREYSVARMADGYVRAYESLVAPGRGEPSGGAAGSDRRRDAGGVWERPEEAPGSTGVREGNPGLVSSTAMHGA